MSTDPITCSKPIPGKRPIDSGIKTRPGRQTREICTPLLSPKLDRMQRSSNILFLRLNRMHDLPWISNQVELINKGKFLCLKK